MPDRRLACPIHHALHPSPNTRPWNRAFRARLGLATARRKKWLRRSEGFTIIETLVAATVLVVGLVTTFTLLDLTVHTSYVTRAREGAVNVAREITEDARAIQYTQLTSSSAATSALQAMPGLASTSSNGWTV